MIDVQSSNDKFALIRSVSTQMNMFIGFKSFPKPSFVYRELLFMNISKLAVSHHYLGQ